jgi:nucleotide-binding universal stress UspA family protein
MSETRASFLGIVVASNLRCDRCETIVKAYRRIVVATDFSPGSQAALGALEALSSQGRALDVHLVHVIEPLMFAAPAAPIWIDYDRARVDDARAQLTRLAGILERRLGASARVRTHFATGPAAAEICRAADTFRADLVIVGTHGRTGLRRAMIGSVAERVVRHAGRPVLAVPQAGPHRPRRRT